MKINNIKINRKYLKITEAELLNQLRILGNAYYSMDLSKRIKRGLQARKDALINDNIANQKTCCIYCRNATANQPIHKSSVKYQKDECIRYANLLGCKVIGIFIDSGYSGIDLERPSLKKLILKCKMCQPDYIIATDTNRFSRNIADYYYLKKLFGLQNAKILLCHQQYSDNDPLLEVLAIFQNRNFNKFVADSAIQQLYKKGLF